MWGAASRRPAARSIVAGAPVWCTLAGECSVAYSHAEGQDESWAGRRERAVDASEAGQRERRQRAGVVGPVSALVSSTGPLADLSRTER